MKNKLFLLCPECQLEHLIREKFGDDICFLTALGAVFDFRSIAYLEELGDFIKREAIKEIIIVNDTSCLFIENLLEIREEYEVNNDAIINAFIDNYTYIMSGDSLMEEKKRLAECNIRRQAHEIINNQFLYSAIMAAGINLKGLITTKKENQVEEIDLLLTESHT